MRLHFVILAALIGLAASQDDECIEMCKNKSQQKKIYCVYISVEKCWQPFSKCELDALRCYTKKETALENEKAYPCKGKRNICAP